MTYPLISRRRWLAGASSLMAAALAGCASTQQAIAPQPDLPRPAGADPVPHPGARHYGALPDERFAVPAVDLGQLDPRWYRWRVDYPTGQAPGSVVVDTASFYLYHVEPGGTAMRYGAGLGRAGFAWSGRGHIAYMRQWPVWTPPAEMIARQPELERWRHGQPPGLDNPLGARALYIHQGNRDTLYRIHGTGEAWSIGAAVSSGCVRLLHQDVIDLAGRVKPGSAIIVL